MKWIHPLCLMGHCFVRYGRHLVCTTCGKKVPL